MWRKERKRNELELEYLLGYFKGEGSGQGRKLQEKTI